jgi:hypothetical protein
MRSIQIRHNLYFSLIFSKRGLLQGVWVRGGVRYKGKITKTFFSSDNLSGFCEERRTAHECTEAQVQ